MNTAPYATPEGIRTYLTSLEGLHRLREDRRSAAARFERLPAYCVLGDYLLTEDGRFGELTGVSAHRVKDLSDVVPLDEFERRGRLAYGEKWRLSYRTPAPLAPHDGLCRECGNGWTFFERADVVETREILLALEEHDGLMVGAPAVNVISTHVRCHEAAVARTALGEACRTLDEAGYAAAAPEPCHAPPGGFGPWFRLATTAGNIRFGCRGPGFAIDWSDTGRDLTGAFCRVERYSKFGPVWNEPPVPHGPFHVDPKDESYLILYLDRLRLALGL